MEMKILTHKAIETWYSVCYMSDTIPESLRILKCTIFCLKTKPKQTNKLTLWEGKQKYKCLIIMYSENGKGTIKDVSRYHMQKLTKSPWSGKRDSQGCLSSNWKDK